MKAIGYLCFDGEPMMRSAHNALLESAKSDLIQKSEAVGLELSRVFADLRLDPENLRSGFETMLKQFSAQEAPAVALKSIDALADRPTKMWEFFKAACIHQVDIYVLDEDRRIGPDESGDIARILELSMSYEKRLSTLRISRGLKQASLLGRKIGRKRFEDRGNTEVLEDILKMRQRGLSLRDICRALNDGSVPTVLQRNWHPTTIKRLLERSSDEKL